MSKNYTGIFNAAKAITPVSEKLDDKNQVKNNAGGFVFEVTSWQRLERFLIMGSEGGTYYVNEKKLTKDNTTNLAKVLAEDGKRVVDTILAISDAGRAPKNAPAVYALAFVAARTTDKEVKKYAFELMPKIARASTDFFAFLQQYKALGGGFGSIAKKGLQNWYQSKEASTLALQLVKYRQRDGWTHHDVLHLAHPKAADNHENNLFAFAKALDGKNNAKYDEALLPDIAVGYLAVQKAKTAKEVASLIEKYRLPWETVPTDFLNDALVWDAALPTMGATALLRNLAKMTSINLITSMSDAEKVVVSKLTDAEWIRKSRIHPMNVLAALMVYKQGHGVKGNLAWTPNSKVITALDTAFYNAFPNVESTGKRIELALDISGSMWGSAVAGYPFIDAATASAAMALILVAREPNVHVSAFTTNYREVDLHAKMRLDDVLKKTKSLSMHMGGTDCSLPMSNALKKKWEFDNFTLFTDNETWAGGHPSQTLNHYRKEMKIPASMIVCAMSGTEFTIADPNDARSLDISGMDSAVPQLIRDFIAN